MVIKVSKNYLFYINIALFFITFVFFNLNFFNLFNANKKTPIDKYDHNVDASLMYDLNTFGNF